MIPEGPESWPFPRSFIQNFPLLELLGKLTLPQIFYTHFSLIFSTNFSLIKFFPIPFPHIFQAQLKSNLLLETFLDFSRQGLWLSLCSPSTWESSNISPWHPRRQDSRFQLFPPNPKGPPLALTSHLTEPQIWFQPVMKSLQRRDWR